MEADMDLDFSSPIGFTLEELLRGDTIKELTEQQEMLNEKMKDFRTQRESNPNETASDQEIELEKDCKKKTREIERKQRELVDLRSHIKVADKKEAKLVKQVAKAAHKNKGKSKKSHQTIYESKEQVKGLINALPKIKVRRVKKVEDIATIRGPYGLEKPEGSMRKFLGARADATYPHYPDEPQRQGDPICDSYVIQSQDNGNLIGIMSDGCNWGEAPKRAAEIAKETMLSYINLHQREIKTVRDAGEILLQALSEAHFDIIEGFSSEDIFACGSTTVLASIMLRVEDEKWSLVVLSIGDCKGMLYSKKQKQVIDITAGNRQNLIDPRDCGGRIGPYSDGGKPDLRNIMLYHTPIEVNDYFFIFSDGIHDNFDPQVLGISPRELNPFLTSDDWKEIDEDEDLAEVGEKEKTQFMCNVMQKIITGKLAVDLDSEISDSQTLEILSNKFVIHALKTTEKSRKWMENNTNKRLPYDYTQYPGKLDHASACAFACVKYEDYFPVNRVKIKEGVLSMVPLSDFTPSKKPQKKLTTKLYQIKLYNDILDIRVVDSIFDLSENNKKKNPAEKINLSLLWLNRKSRTVKDSVSGSMVKGHELKGPEKSWLLCDGVEDWLTLINKTIKKAANRGQGSDLRWGKYEFPGVGTYEGEWSDCEIHGQGIFSSTDETIYDGYWDKSMKAGFGTITKQGQQYDGGWENNLLSQDGKPRIKENSENDVEDAPMNLSELTDRDWQLLLTGAKISSYSSGDLIMKEGTHNNHLFKLKTGQVEVQFWPSSKAKKPQVTTMKAPSMFGEMSVLGTKSTAAVIAKKDVELYIVELSVVYELFKSSHGLARRFYRRMACKLADRLEHLHTGEQDQDSPNTSVARKTSSSELIEVGDSSDSETIDSSLIDTDEGISFDPGSLERYKSDLRFCRKFGFSTPEVIIKHYVANVSVKLLKQWGKIYVSQNYTCFFSKVFGRVTKIICPFDDITNVRKDKSNLYIDVGKKDHKFTFERPQDAESCFGIVESIWNTHEKSGNNVDTSGNSEVEQGDTEILSKDDWDLIMNGATRISYKKNEVVFKEGEITRRIFQIGRGTLRIEKTTGIGPPLALGTMGSRETFGEISFLQGGGATATVIANSDDVDVYQIEAQFLHILFVRHSALAGKFYHHLSSVLSNRLVKRAKNLDKLDSKK